MSRLTDRPFAGTFELNLRKVTKHTPDAIVFLNGDVSVPGCPSCGGRIDIQKYITSVSCEPSTNPIASASISLSIPGYESHGLFRDGKFLLDTGLEVHVYMRGFFPAKGMLEGDDAARTADPNGAVLDTAMYPYYLVFHGVVTSTSFSYSSGSYSASLSCADLLHFWQYQRLVEQGAVLGNNFAGSKVDSSLVGHNFSGMSPYSIIYTLYRDTMGAAGGVESVILPDSDVTNAASVSSVDGQPLFKHAERYWKKRFAQTLANLRMFGANGSLYSSAQAAFLARLNSEQIAYLAGRADNPALHSQENDPMSPLLRTARAVGFDPYTLFASAAGGVSGGVGGNESGAGLGVNAASFQAYVSDISKWGQFNLFETTYLTKLEIANAVTQVTGFEFYQDVDGDIVFKPPFYNMDTSGLRVYRIEPEDVISFDTQAKEPDCTVVKITGGQFSNQAGVDLTGEFGIRAEFVDFRAVAKYGWRQEVFDSSYFNDARSAFYAAIAKYDIYNIGVNTASVTIPLRPELRPGYPVYIAHIDCFYYVTSISHSFSYGGDCQSTLTLVGRRSKFHGPGVAPGDKLPGIHDVDLSNMHLPELPLTLPGMVTGQAQAAGYATGDPSNPYVDDPYAGATAARRTQGIPNVVMSLDPTLTPPLTRDYSSLLDDLSTADGVKKIVRSLLGSRNSPLQRSPNAPASRGDKGAAYDGPFQIQLANGSWRDLPSYEQIATVARQAKTAGKSWQPSATLDDAPSALQFEVELVYSALLAAAQRAYDRTIPGGSDTAYALERVSDFKSMFSPGKAVPKGYYRYYTSAHPDAEQQGMRTLNKDGTAGALYQFEGRATQFSDDGSGFVLGSVSAGIPIATAGGGYIVKPTDKITTFDLARLEVELDVPVTVAPATTSVQFPATDLTSALQTYFSGKLQGLDPAEDFLEQAQALFESERSRLAAVVRKLPVPTALSPKGSGVFGIDVLVNPQGVAEFVTSQWNPARFHPKKKEILPHKGTDLRAAIGTPVLAANQGKVTFVSQRASSSAGLYIEIEHGSADPDTFEFKSNGWKTRYLHLSLIQVKRGAFVSLGQQIGLSGNSGLINSGPHLHFELIRNSSSVDAQRYRVEGDGFVAVSEATSTVGPALIENAQFPAVASVSGIPNGVNPFTQTPAYLIAALSPPATATSPSPVSSTQLIQISYDMGQALATPCAEVLTAYSRNNPDGNRKFASAWSELFPAGTSQPPLLSVTPSTQTPNKRKVPVEVPVFPVSDARGYEVVGTYAYGRGINLATDQQTLLQRAGLLPDYGAVEAFVDSIQFGSGSTAGVTQAISNLDADTRADLAATTFDDTLRSVLTPPAPGKAGRGENVPSSSAQGVGVFSPLNAAYGLADMQVGGMDACKCYLNQPDVLFLTGALNGELLAIEGQTGDFLDAVRGQVASVVPGWAATQDAYRGGSTAYDPRTTAQIVSGAVDQIQQAVSQVDNGLTDATRRTRA